MPAADARTGAALLPVAAPHYWFGKLDEQASAWLTFLDRYLAWVDAAPSSASHGVTDVPDE